MPLSEEARSRWCTYLDAATNGFAPKAQDDEYLYEFVAYAFIQEPEALENRSSLYALMCEYALSEHMMNRVFRVLDAAPGLMAACERERGGQRVRLGPARSRRTAVTAHSRMAPAHAGGSPPA